MRPNNYFDFFFPEHLGQRDRYTKERETYFERQNNSNPDHRDFRREREPYRERISGDHDRERFDKERYSREDRYEKQKYLNKKMCLHNGY